MKLSDVYLIIRLRFSSGETTQVKWHPHYTLSSLTVPRFLYSGGQT